LLSFSCSGFALLNYYVQIASLSLPVIPRAANSRRFRLLTAVPRTERRYMH
jgi:hypothetical protein